MSIEKSLNILSIIGIIYFVAKGYGLILKEYYNRKDDNEDSCDEGH